MNNDFRLISMYIGDFDCLRKQMINFCSDYTTSVVENKNSKRKYLWLMVKYGQTLPNDFFALNEGNEGNGCVKSVTTIIGKNGAGKTSLARLFCNLPASDERKRDCKVVVIYELNGVLKAYSTVANVKIEKQLGVGKVSQIVPETDNCFSWPYKFFYYSPHFTTEQLDIYTTGYHADNQTHEEGDVVSDISTTNLMLHPDGNSESLIRMGMSQLSLFDVDEKIRLFEFVSAYKRKAEQLGIRVEKHDGKRCAVHSNHPLSMFKIPMPSSVSIGIHHEGFRLAIRKMADYVETCRREESGVQKKIYPGPRSSIEELRDPVGEYLRTVIGVFDQFGKQPNQYSLVVNVFMSYAARYIEECGMLNSSSSFPATKLRQGFLVSLKGFITGGGWQDDEQIIQFFREHVPDLPIGEDGNVGADGRLSNSPSEMIKILQKFVALNKVHVNRGQPTVRISENIVHIWLEDAEAFNDVCRLVQLHGSLRVISAFLKFDVCPHMSSGEMCFLSLFSRLHHFVGKVSDDENVVVFLDEAETTLHPEWQRCLVAYCIRFFEVFLPSKRYQLIFASHSPMLLSDIPKGNVCCLDRDKKGYCYVREIDADNTFAANIYDLYATSYFLTGGPIGDFARSKIQNLQKQEDEKIVNLVGDELLKRLLQRKVGVCDN